MANGFNNLDDLYTLYGFQPRRNLPFPSNRYLGGGGYPLQVPAVSGAGQTGQMASSRGGDIKTTDSASFGSTALEMAPAVLDELGKILGGNKKPAGSFQPKDVRGQLHTLYEMLGYVYNPKMNRWESGKAPNLSVYGIGPESRRMAMQEIESQAQPQFAREQARLARSVGGNQPGLAADLGTRQRGSLLDLYRDYQISENERTARIVSDIFRQINEIFGLGVQSTAYAQS